MSNYSKNSFWWNDGRIEKRSKVRPGDSFVKGKIPKSSEEIKEKFWSTVDVRDEDDCWEWKGLCASCHMPYGRFYFENKTQEAHRVSWKLTKNDPGKLCVLHKCDNPKCVNPNHLFLGTKGDNNRDRNYKGRTNVPKGEEHKLSKLTDGDVFIIRRLYNESYGISEIARRYGVSKSTIWNIIRRNTWKHVI